MMFDTWFDQEAAKILEKFWNIRQIPVDPFSISTKAGLSVSHHMSYSQEDKHTHFIHGHDDIRSQIDYPLCGNHFKERFMVAHALAHHLLEHEDHDDTQECYTHALCGSQCHEANELALALLVPARTVRLSMKYVNSVEELGALYQVSKDMIVRRLEQLSQRPEAATGEIKSTPKLSP